MPCMSGGHCRLLVDTENQMASRMQNRLWKKRGFWGPEVKEGQGANTKKASFLSNSSMLSQIMIKLSGKEGQGANTKKASFLSNSSMLSQIMIKLSGCMSYSAQLLVRALPLTPPPPPLLYVFCHMTYLTISFCAQ